MLVNWKRGSLTKHALLLAYSLALLVIIVLAGVAGDSPAGAKVGSLLGAIPFFDKLGHFLLFGALAFLVHWSFLHRGFTVFRWVALTSAVAAVVLAEECTQAWLPGRSFDLADMAADVAGILVFSAFAYFGMRRRMRA